MVLIVVFRNRGRASIKHPHVERYTYGCRRTSVMHENDVEIVPELQPELVVPSGLDDCPLKPYVSYRTREIYQEPVTAYDLFNVTYGKEIMRRYEAAKEAGDEEAIKKLETEEMRLIEDPEGEARRTGADKFVGGVPRPNQSKIRWQRDV